MTRRKHVKQEEQQNRGRVETSCCCQSSTQFLHVGLETWFEYFVDQPLQSGSELTVFPVWSVFLRTYSKSASETGNPELSWSEEVPDIRFKLFNLLQWKSHYLFFAWCAQKD